MSKSIVLAGLELKCWKNFCNALKNGVHFSQNYGDLRKKKIIQTLLRKRACAGKSIQHTER